MNNKPYLAKYHEAVANDSKANARDRIWLSYVDEDAVTLTPKEEEQKGRYQKAISLLNNYYSPEQAVAQLLQSFSGISQAQAYRDVNDAVLLYGNLKENLNKGINHILYEYAMKIMQMAANQKPPDLKAMNMAWKNAYLAMGLDKDNSSIISPEDFEGNTYEIIVNVSGAGRKRKPINIDDLSNLKPEKFSDLLDAVDAQEITEDEMESILDEENNA